MYAVKTLYVERTKISRAAYMNPFVSVQGTDASDDKLQIGVTMTDQISRRATHKDPLDSVKDMHIASDRKSVM